MGSINLSEIFNFSTNQVLPVLVSVVLSFAIGLFVYLIYRLTFSGVIYSKTFNMSLVMLSMVSTLVILIMVKEALMIAGGLIMLKQRKVAYSDWYGKTATGLFAIGIVMTLLSFVVEEIEPWNIAVLAAAIALSYVALAHYAKTQLFRPREEEPDEEENKLFEKFDRLAK